MDIAKEMELFKNNVVYDWHEHVGSVGNTDRLDEAKCDRLAEHAKMLYIDRVAVSRPSSRYETPERVREINNVVAEGVKRHEGFFYGMCFVDPHHGGCAVDEIERCVSGMGFVGVKLYTQATIDDPMQYPIIEKCIELGVPILMHSMKFSKNYPGPEPFASHAAHFTNAANKYPEAVFIIAHIGNGDRHWQLKGISDCPNVFCDMSGSAFDQGTVEDIVSVFGAERVLFASDGSLSSSVGKILGADLSDDQKKTILGAPRFAKYMERGAR